MFLLVSTFLYREALLFWFQVQIYFCEARSHSDMCKASAKFTLEALSPFMNYGGSGSCIFSLAHLSRDPLEGRPTCDWCLCRQSGLPLTHLDPCAWDSPFAYIT